MNTHGFVRTVLAMTMAGALFAGHAYAAQPDSLRRDSAGDLSRHFLGPAEPTGTWVLRSDRGNLAIGGFVKVANAMLDQGLV